MTHEEGLALLVENAALKKLVAELQDQIEMLSNQLAELEKKQKTPSFVKANRPKKEGSPKTRKKRAGWHNQARRREEPTRVETHAVEECVTCGYHLRGESEDYRRQVIELPEPQPVEVIEHRMMKRWCPVCQAWQRPEMKWGERVVGQGRIGVRLGALIAYLHQNLRAPVRVIKGYLATIHQVRLSVGEISELLKRLHRQVRPAIDALKHSVHQQAVVHGDETGWRENGQNGYVWCLATDGEAAIRYYEYDRRRNREVVTRLLGDEFKGHLVSDFYGAYNIYSGPHQRCWVHLLRDLEQLREEQQNDGERLAWVLAIRFQYQSAQEASRLADLGERQRHYDALWQRTQLLGLQYAQVKNDPCQAMAKRLLRHIDELYQFVLYPYVPADNNLAERALRPVVVQRKISGGTRSRDGSETRLGLASLFGTWQARNLNPYHEFLALLVRPMAASP
jgi:transposase